MSLISERAIVVGSSFGAVVALEAVRSYAERVAGAVLLEPPMAATDDLVIESSGYLAALDQVASERGAPAAGEAFLRLVLGNEAFERMPRSFQQRSAAKWTEIRSDVVTLSNYRPRYAELGRVLAPVLLLGAERSAPYFRPTLQALAGALPHARLEIVAKVGHMLHAEAPRRFAELLIEFADDLVIE